MELSAVGERVFAAESIIKRRIRKVRGRGRRGERPRDSRPLPAPRCRASGRAARRCAEPPPHSLPLSPLLSSLSPPCVAGAHRVPGEMERLGHQVSATRRGARRPLPPAPPRGGRPRGCGGGGNGMGWAGLGWRGRWVRPWRGSGANPSACRVCVPPKPPLPATPAGTAPGNPRRTSWTPASSPPLSRSEWLSPTPGWGGCSRFGVGWVSAKGRSGSLLFFF